MAGLQLSTTDTDDDAVMTAALSLARGTTPLHDPETALELAAAPLWDSFMLHLLVLHPCLIMTLFLLVYRTLHPVYLTQYLCLMISLSAETFVRAPSPLISLL
ncbi:hypothetical protein Hanom_Chr10g00899271 [Helianthus anomalus]